MAKRTSEGIVKMTATVTEKYYFYQGTGDSAHRIIEFLYKDCGVSIRRKYETAALILGGDANANRLCLL